MSETTLMSVLRSSILLGSVNINGMTINSEWGNGIAGLGYAFSRVLENDTHTDKVFIC